MQAEHFSSRPNGFIVSPTHTYHFTKPVQKSKPLISSEPFSALRENISLATAECHSYAKKRLTSFAKSILSSSVAVCCCVVFFNFFTFGTVIYHNGSQIAVSNGEEPFLSSLNEAQRIASSYGSTLSEKDFLTFPMPVLRSSISKENSLCDKLLLCSENFVSSCTLYSNDTPVFHAENADIAAHVVEEYISSYSLNGDAKPSTKLSFRTDVIPKENLSDESECARLLSESDSVSVISVVTASSQESVPFDVKTEKDSSLYLGESVTVIEGKEGRADLSVQKVYENGSEQSSTVLSEKIVIKPVSKVVRIGTKQKEVLKSGLFYPLSGVISSSFGSRWGSVHEGLDIAVSEGTVVAAAECGTVCFVSENAGGYGKLVRIDHGYGVKTAYAHLSRIDVSVGEVVAAGAPIALSGNTGRSTGPHLHFEVIHNGTPLDPTRYLKK